MDTSLTVEASISDERGEDAVEPLVQSLSIFPQRTRFRFSVEMEFIAEYTSDVEESPSNLELRKETMGEEHIGFHTEDVSAMDAVMCCTLPKELIRLVFAQLPLSLLLSLRSASVKQKWDINLDDSEFRRLCAESHSSLCAFILKTAECGFQCGALEVAVLHSVADSMDSTSWQSVKVNVDAPFKMEGLSSDGGLVCFALRAWCNDDDPAESDGSLVIVVVNPLTGDCRVLPNPSVCPTQFNMIHLVVEQCTKHYKVMLLVNSMFASVGGVGAMIFDSGTGVWSNSKNSSLQDFLGLYYLYVNEIFSCGIYPQAFDCATGELFRLAYDPESDMCFDKIVSDYAFVEDRLFLLYIRRDERLTGFGLSEHQIEGQKDGRLRWTKVKDHHFGPTDHQRLAHLRVHRKLPCLYACKGFLLVVGNFSDTVHTTAINEFAWLYNLSTGACLDVRKQREPGRQRAWNPHVFCELRWDVVP